MIPALGAKKQLQSHLSNDFNFNNKQMFQGLCKTLNMVLLHNISISLISTGRKSATYNEVVHGGNLLKIPFLVCIFHLPMMSTIKNKKFK